jgi:hypothetical protein
MQTLNKVAIGFFVFAKIFGFLGVCLGFLGRKDYRSIGGRFLSLAMISIFSSVTCSLIQSRKDEKPFQKKMKKIKK